MNTFKNPQQRINAISIEFLHAEQIILTIVEYSRKMEEYFENNLELGVCCEKQFLY